MKEGIEVIESWGFRYVDEMVWDKYYLGLSNAIMVAAILTTSSKTIVNMV